MAAPETAGFNFDALLNLAFAYLENKEKEKAVELFKEFEKTAPPTKPLCF